MTEKKEKLTSCPNCQLADLSEKKDYRGSRCQCPVCKAILTFDQRGGIKLIERILI